MTPENCRPTEILSPKTLRQLAHLDELSKPSAQLRLVINDATGELEAFAWGYQFPEVRVSPPLRGNGLGFRLTLDLWEYARKNKLPIVFRTNWASPMMRIAQRLEMKQIMGPRIQVVDNQITKTNEISGFLDRINPDRTLFINLP